ncbi:MAG: archaetidylserine decarboxylase [Gammaproteobacteria bacterium]|nr:archaetidylserine decarboxylase [Gammaproteobacteria bacterium]MCD8542848.1 archaetidylserine decarboxylase [Gammaproteobacteria bacterium]MCD8573668.1 archaetidylserine decarboxylase [Gammaproteobacteria bacterium]
MAEAIEKNPLAYDTFHDFFIRRLKAEARPIHNNKNNILSPADGRLSQHGFLDEDTLLQAKGKPYSVSALLAHDQILAHNFYGGAYGLIYLAPHNYHRVHMPLAGNLLKMIYVPGKLYSVSPTTAENIDGLFAKNERVIIIFETSIGKMAVILVGAMIVGSISTIWAGKITPPRKQRSVTHIDYEEQNIRLSAGQELGYFSLGSTVIVLFQKNTIEWNSGLENTEIQMGQNLGHTTTNSNKTTR